MKLYRAPKTSSKWDHETGVKKASQLKDWVPGDTIGFNGTIDQKGSRHTSIGVKIQREDFRWLIQGFAKDFQQLQKDLAQKARDCDDKERALRLISNLISYYRDSAPSMEDLLQCVTEIADRFADTEYSDSHELPNPKWINLKKHY